MKDKKRCWFFHKWIYSRKMLMRLRHKKTKEVRERVEKFFKRTCDKCGEVQEVENWEFSMYYDNKVVLTWKKTN